MTAPSPALGDVASTSAVPPKVTVVVPTVDRVDLLDRCLAGLARPQGASFEVVVVHDGDAGVRAVLDRWHDLLPLRGIQISERGAGPKRNAGWRAARADVIAFTDDDCQPTDGWLEAGVRAMRPEIELVQGRVERHPDDAHVQGIFARTIEVTEPSAAYANANLFYRRSALERVGGFDTAVWGGGEDTDLAWRVIESGGQVTFADDAVVHHAVRAVDLRSHLRSLPRWATLALVLRRHPQLRPLIHRRVFWKRSHPTALVALVGLLLAVVDRRAALLVAPLLARRTREAGWHDGAQLAVADIAEVAVVLTGSARYRTVLL